MDLAQKCRLLHGDDTYSSYQALKRIENRFLRHAQNMVDFSVCDLEETSLEHLKQRLLAIPFLVTHRLFLLKNSAKATKATQEGLQALLTQLGPSTYVVLYESASYDKRSAFYKWLEKNVKVETYNPLSEGEVAQWLTKRCTELGVTLHGSARAALRKLGTNLWQLDNELKKLTAAALAQGGTVITTDLVTTVCHIEEEVSVFGLAETLKAKQLPDVMVMYRTLRAHHDAMFLAGTLGSTIRSLTKLHLAMRVHGEHPDAVARATKLHPYVVKLTLPLAKSLSPAAIKRSYQLLIQFEERVKGGLAEADTALLLLVIQLHGTLKGR